MDIPASDMSVDQDKVKTDRTEKIWGAKNLGFIVVVALVCTLTVNLGLWQLDRAQQKSDWQSDFIESMVRIPVMVGDNPAPFTRVKLTGTYRDEHFLVDNRTHRGQAGYWVVSRFDHTDGRVILVNRGWLKAPQMRAHLPNVETPTEPVTLTAVMWPDTGLPALYRDDPWADSWPKRIQRLNLARMATVDEKSVLAMEARLEPGNPGVATPAPMASSVNPDRHRGYALQWFGLSVVVVVGLVVYFIRLRRTATKTVEDT
jgi:cytochrome oxidase assembly protein ShyY1